MAQPITVRRDPPPGFVSTQISGLHCCVCFELMRDVANLTPCNHKMCMTCAGRMKLQSPMRCPQCRADAEGFALDHAYSGLVMAVRDAHVLECSRCHARYFDRGDAERHVCAAEAMPPLNVIAAELRDTNRYPCTFALAYMLTSFLLAYRKAAITLCQADNADGWWALGRTLMNGERLTINGSQMSDQDCYRKALDFDRAHSLSWNNLGTCLTDSTPVTIDNTAYSKQQCYVQAVVHDGTNALAWCNLASTMQGEGWLKVGTRRVSRIDCLKLALVHNPDYSVAWQNLGVTLLPGERELVNGRRWSQRECYEKAAFHGPQNADAWYLLGASMRPKERALVGSAQVGPKECFVNALTVDGNMQAAWAALAAVMEDGCMFPETISVNGVCFTKAECEARGL